MSKNRGTAGWGRGILEVFGFDKLGNGKNALPFDPQPTLQPNPDAADHSKFDRITANELCKQAWLKPIF